MFNPRGNPDPRGRGRGRGGKNNSRRPPQTNNNNNKNGEAPKFKHKQWTRPGLKQQQEPMDSPSGTMSNAQRAKRFGGDDKSALFLQLKKKRASEREEAIRLGLIDDPNTPRRLEDAIDFRGTCQSMCPDFELVEREVQHMLDPLEKDAFGHADPSKAVKRYRRSAAGNEQALPSDVRPPGVLVKTLDYLIGTVLSSIPFIECHAFLWDRTRSIRQDFTLQNIRNAVTVQVHEHIARFHILALHELCEYSEEKFSQQQEFEQLGKVLISLMEFYDDLRAEGISLPNEGEFRAYHLIYNLRDHELASRMITTLPPSVQAHPYLKQAFRFYEYSQRNNEIMQTSERRNKPENVLAAQNAYAKVFKLVGSAETPFLLACMFEVHFAEVRKGALKAMGRSYVFQYKGPDVEYLRQLLAYDSEKHVLTEVELYGLVVDIADGEAKVRFGQKTKGKTTLFIEPLSLPRQRKSKLLVDPKKGGRSYYDIIFGTQSNETAICTTPIVRALQPSRLPGVTTKITTFLPEKPRTLLPVDQVKEFSVVQRIVNVAPSKTPEELAAERQRRLLREQQQKQAEMERMRQQQEEERQRRVEMEERMRAEAERKQQVAAAAAAAETLRRRLEQEKKERAAMQERQQRQAMLQELNHVLAQEILQTIVSEETQVAALRTLHQSKTLKRKMDPHVQRARQVIEKRRRDAQDRASIHRLVDRMARVTFKPKQNKEQRVKECLYLEGRALRDLRSQRTPAQSLLEAVWETENLAQVIKPCLNLTSRDAQCGWELWIYVDSVPLESSKWFKQKFGLDDEFGRRVERYKDVNNVTVRTVSPRDALYGKSVDQMGGLIFSLSETRVPGTDDCNNANYWMIEKRRLNELTKKLMEYNPHVRVPAVFTYWPQTESLKQAVEMIPDLLELDTNPMLLDYHIVIMNPYTITTRLHEELRWLAVTSNNMNIQLTT
ncbi:SAC3/GANP/Nin1/mts3/eIF-3 p25 family-domain-containing protein [Fennellomyces sp. T-0311]|nr:SAC3/GANP/Nin1/mts3/eIF-3 p25 family-domain-containing protein [Fennellomyces sp. T-0311]